MTRFWRLDNRHTPGGEHFYIDPSEIVAVDFDCPDDDNKEPPEYTVTLRSGEMWYLQKGDGEKLMRWAESQAENIPEVEHAMEWK